MGEHPRACTLSTIRSCQCVGATPPLGCNCCTKVLTQSTEIATMLRSSDGETPRAPEQQPCIQPKTHYLTQHTSAVARLSSNQHGESLEAHMHQHTLGMQPRLLTGRAGDAHTEHTFTLKTGRASGTALCWQAQHSTPDGLHCRAGCRVRAREQAAADAAPETSEAAAAHTQLQATPCSPPARNLPCLPPQMCQPLCCWLAVCCCRAAQPHN